MTRDDDSQTTDEQTADMEGRGAEGRRESVIRTRRSRRRFLAASAALGAGALALGTGESATAAPVEEKCNTEEFGQIQVADGFALLDNQWGNSDADQCIWLHEDGSYGYDFDASDTGGGINYPEVLVGTKPWGSDTGVDEFPVRRRNVDELVIDVEAEYSQSGGEWDWAEEWWLMEQPPSQETETHQYEVMLLLDWNDQHDHGEVTVEGAWTDQYGNTVDHWTTYGSGGTDATFYIFRIQGGHDGGKVDMTEVVDYLTAEHDVAEDLWLSGIELGNEYWGGCVGETTYETFDVTVNGSTYTSGSDGGDQTSTPTPTETPTDVPDDTPTDTPDDTPTDTPDDTPTDTPDDTPTQTDTPDGGDPGSALVVNDYDGDPAWDSHRNDLGEWCGAGSFENGSGEVRDGALVLEYDNGGWLQEQINRDVSDRETLVLRLSGASGGEESEVQFSMGGVSTLLSEVTSDSVGTSASDVTVDLDSAGVDPSASGLSVRLNFWQGGASTLEIHEIRLE
ncbi:GH12 family glycosyl hydrolase domain-containing protein [Halosimplex amylolyticum]|uniref:GH12 family glycosyl hydrolase domain-containing protein n=1 Tax=Halosimplex amylolyticum TaxID=3396616 RepID=UPI003F54C98F